MSETKISGIGNILTAKNAAKLDSDGQKTQENSCFADMIREAGKKNVSTYGVQSKNVTTDSFQKEKLQSDEKVSSDYNKYKYKDHSIQTQKNEIRDKNVINEKVTEFAEEVKQVLSDELGVTEEELEQAMETLGIQYLDLLDRGNLANLVAVLTGSDNVNQLLCSESFNNVLQSVYMLGTDLLQSLQMKGSELKQVFEMLSGEMEQPVLDEEILNQGNPESIAEEKDTNAFLVDESAVEQKTADSDADGSYLTVKMENQHSDAAKEGQSAEEESTLGTEGKMTTLTEETANMEEELSGGSQEKSGKSQDSGEKTLMNGNQNDAGIAAASPQSNVLEQLGKVETVQNVPEYVSVRDIMEQIVDSAKVTLSNDMSKMEMQLNPENLGKIFLEVTQREGAVTAKIETQNAIVKEALEAQIAELKQNMNQAGIKVDSVEVTVASHEFERNLEQGAKGEEHQAEEQEKAAKQRKINLNSLDELSGLMTEEEALVAKIMAEQGNSVDYTA